jgi:membrane-bound lytic murein transglycosylase MltF
VAAGRSFADPRGRSYRRRAEPQPVVRQTGLLDFYVQYTLLVCLEQPHLRVATLDALHANILDAFNEYGVQITSPNYEADPGAPKFVPRNLWFAAPAAPGARRNEAKRASECESTMMNMNRQRLLVAAGLSAAALFVVTRACGRAEAPQPAQAAASASPAPAPSAAAAPARPDETEEREVPSDAAIATVLKPWTGDLDGMVARRYIRVLVTFSKTNYFLDRAEQHGATYDAGKLFEEFLNKRLGSKNVRVQLAFIPVSRDRLFQALAEGRGDIAAAGLTITPERQKRVDFATPFATGVRELVVTSASQPAVATAEDLSGREVHVRKSSAYHDSLLALNARLAKAGRPPVRIVDASDQLEDEDILEMVNAGLIPATIVNNHLAEFWARIFDQIRVQPAAVRTDGEIAWALRRNTPQLRQAVNDFAAANSKGSLAFNVVYQKYFKNTKWVTNATSESEMKKFREAVVFFKKYGNQYDLPWLLVAAQAYQESTIDQSKKSNVGAVGVMQIKPATAAGAPISISGVEASTDRNIEAGAKYLRFIVDRYYKDAPMTQVNKGLFAVASYNAGPAKIAQLRKKAQAQGLDPNVWFGNVEVVAAREIGRETVQYVSNIYKYYVSYQLIQKQNAARSEARKH